MVFTVYLAIMGYHPNAYFTCFFFVSVYLDVIFSYRYTIFFSSINTIHAEINSSEF